MDDRIDDLLEEGFAPVAQTMQYLIDATNNKSEIH